MAADTSTAQGKRTRPRIPAAAILAALDASGGCVNEAAKIASMSARQLRRRIRQDPALREARDEAVEEALDIAESGLMAAIKKGRLRACCFYLLTRGKSRGYVMGRESRELAPAGGSVVTYTPAPLTAPESAEPAGAVH